VEIDVTPSAGERDRHVLAAALARAGIEANGPPPGYASRWRRAGFAEAVEREAAPAPAPYAPSPRSSRGATRA
jgi:hypothetical protein